PFSDDVVLERPPAGITLRRGTSDSGGRRMTPSAPSGPIPGRLDRLLAVGTVAGMSDDELLGRFARRDPGSETAFEGLVTRHGPMVLHVCWRILGDRHAAEDAFQATFLLLARRAGALHVRGTLAPWLHEVARRMASKSREAARRLRVREQRAATATRIS